ncbi:tryptophan synthase subunit alpha [Streptomyces lydicus]|uniref:tryptophan synthase subunit alpha n=1 Tax=Streptomyces lydicus TaxID=47763 RepID=UPI001011301B|nr:tryptophan synthase subunit alpha [Streptomyces lydicus]MCZ1012069.1 tryptophan synthase subunit alpha [Streptomyces lydicus]
MTRGIHVRDPMFQAAVDLGRESEPERLRPVLGAFSVAGFPDLRSSVDAFVTYAESGAAMLEVGAPAADPWLDGPAIAEAHRCALGAGDGVSTTLETVRRVSARSDTPVVVMSYWPTVQALGPQGMADELAASGAAGCLVPDVPPEHVEEWAAAATEAGISAPLLANRSAPSGELRMTCRAATGFVYAPAAAGQRTGYASGIDLDSLAAFTRSLRNLAPSTPILTGIGVSTPELAAAAVRHGAVDGVVVGSRLIHAFTDGGLSGAAELVQQFATSIAEAWGE